MDLNSKRLLINDAINTFSEDLALLIADEVQKENDGVSGTVYVTGRAEIKKDKLLKLLFSRLSDDELIQLKLDHLNFINSIQKFDI